MGTASNTLKRLIVLLIAVSLLATTNVGVVNAQQEFLIYENPAYGVEIDYPSDWEVSEIPSGFDFVISFTPRAESNSDIFVQGIDVVVEPIPEFFTLDEFTEYEIDFLKDIYEEFRIEEETPITLAGNPAHKIVFTGTFDGHDTPGRVMEVWTVKDGTAYLIAYYAEPSTYPTYLGTAQKMIDSFEIDEGEFPKSISGKYFNSDLGLQIDFPAGWMGFENIGDNQTIVEVSPGIIIQFTGVKQIVSMSVVVVDIEEIISEEILTEDECSTPTLAAIIRVNDMKVIEYDEIECRFPEMTLYEKVYSLATEEKVVYVVYDASSENVYDSNIRKFEESLKTLKIENTIDLSDPGNAPLFGLTLSKETVMVKDKPYDIEIVSNSDVSDFTFSEENKLISFKVEAKKGSDGFTTLYIGEVLEGPYTVTIDGKPMDDVMLVEDKTNGETSVDLIYAEGVHNITMIGTQVVPEFSLLIPTIFATAILLIFATKLMPRLNKVKIIFWQLISPHLP